MRKRVLLPLIAGGAMAAAGTVAWLNRETIASDYVDAALTERGVRATYEIDRIGVRRQRLRNVVIGDPARPDLVAREIEVTLGVGWNGPYLTGARARGVRLNGAWQDGRLTLGAIDRLLPESDGSPFALPDIALDLADASARIDTPWGRMGFAVAGAGRLTDGFAGDVVLAAPRLALGDCTASGTRGRVGVTITDGAPRLQGPMGIPALRCLRGDVALTDLRIGLDASANADLIRIASTTGVRGGRGRIAGVAMERLRGTIGIEGAPAGAMDATWQLAGSDVAQGWVVARRVTIDGKGRRLASGAIAADGRVGLSGGRAGVAATRRLAGLARMDDSTPVGPLARKLAAGLTDAGRAFTADGGYRLTSEPGRGLRLESDALSLVSDNGARFAIAGERALIWDAGTGLALAGTGRMSGGGLPEAEVALRRVGGGLSGEARFAPFAADGARLALAPIRFDAAPNGRTRFASAVTLSGPLADGFVDGLAMPVAGTLRGDGSVALDGGCRDVRWQSLRTSGVTLDPASLRLCGAGTAPLLAWSGARGLTGGATIPGFVLNGRTGTSPLRVAGSRARIGLGRLTFALNDVDAVVGGGESPTRLRALSLTGAAGAGGYAGTLTGGNGTIGPTPFLLSGADGRWTWREGALRLDTGLIVDDAAIDDRFQRLLSDAVAVTYTDGVVRAEGRLREAMTGTTVADLTIDHRFASGVGAARFTVPGIAFVRDGLQPLDISRLALGVVANVAGTVDGGGTVRWSPAGVTSDGRFTTTDMDLAAAFGPVENLAGTIRFDDLLALTTPPGQEARLGSVNPGIEVLDGRLLYQLLPDRQVRIESGTWPFAGGQLLLQPALLDFSAERARRLTFDVANVDAALFLQRYDFENISATGIFDGVLPTVFDGDGGRVVGGSLVSRDGGGTLAYVGELSNRDLGVMANLAYGALKSLRYDNLVIRLNGDIDGEMVTEVDFTGLAQGDGAERNFLTRAIARLPFTFRIKINAPFRQLLTSARGLYDPTGLIEQNLPALIQAERDAIRADAERRGGAATDNGDENVQPSESEDRR